MTVAGVSVVIPAYRSWRTLPTVLDALMAQIVDRAREVIVVEGTGDGRAQEIHGWGVRVVELHERIPQGAARNIEARAARGTLTAFLDADVVPAPDWLDALEAAVDEDVDSVAGAILNGTGRSLWASAAHIFEFLEWFPTPAAAPAARSELQPHGPSRRVLEAGGFAEDVWTARTRS